MICAEDDICRQTKGKTIWLFASVLLWLATVMSIATSASATISVPVPEHDLVRQSVAIVVGQVKTIESFSEAQESLIFTLITLTVDEVLKGEVFVSELMIKQSGGTVDGRHSWVFGSPEFTLGEHVLLFLSCDKDGVLHVAHFYQGKFSIVSDKITGKKMASRGDNPAHVYVLSGGDKDDASGFNSGEIRELDSFKARIRALVDEETQSVQNRSTPPIRFTTPSVTGVSEYQPKFHTPNMSRWFEPDDGAPVTMRVNAKGEPNAPGFGFEQILSALKAWSGVEGSSFHFQDGEFTDAKGFQADGVSAISFGDPLGQMDPAVNCVGLLAIAGFMQDVTETRIVNGESFFRITEGDVVFNTGWKGCGFLEDFDNLAEVATHELGHVLGLAHSTDPEAIMYPYAHFDGRGGSLGKDDLAGLFFLYPATIASPGKTKLISPSGITDHRPTYTWRTVPGATWYYLWVNDSTGNKIKTWYKASDVQSGKDPDICSVKPDIELEEGKGRWWVRAWNTNGDGLWSDPMLFTVGWEPARMWVSPKIVSSADQLEVSWDGIVTPTAKDWLGLYEPEADDTTYLTWCYTGGAAGGKMPFELPSWLTPGNYELRLFTNNSFHCLAVSNTFTVDWNPAKVRVYPKIVLSFDKIGARWEGIVAPTAKDWLGLYEPGADNATYLAWSYTDGAAGGRMLFDLPTWLQPGSYELRLFANNTYNRLATSNAFKKIGARDYW